VSSIATEASGLDSLCVASHGWSDESRTRTERGVLARDVVFASRSRHRTNQVKCLIHVAAVVYT